MNLIESGIPMSAIAVWESSNDNQRYQH